jgi:Polyketide cyclase / dehydrase and lipid transport
MSGRSGRKFSFEVNQTSTAPAATLFRLVADGANWSQWAKPVVVQSSWVRQGNPAPGGIGAIRKVGMWPVAVQEETVEYEQDRRHVYKLVAPSTPAKDYVGEVVLTPNAAGGTDIRWSGSFTEGVAGSGPMVRAAMGGAIKFFAGRLVKAAERESGAGR